MKCQDQREIPACPVEVVFQETLEMLDFLVCEISYFQITTNLDLHEHLGQIIQTSYF